MKQKTWSPNENATLVPCDTFYGPFRMQNAMKTFIFLFDPRKCQGQVKDGQIPKFGNAYQKHTRLVQFYLRIPKMPFIFKHAN